MAQGPLCFVAVIAVSLVLDLPKQDQSHWKEKFFKIDFLGAATLIIAVSGLLVGLDRGSNGDWTSPITIAGLCTTPMFIVFVLVEKYVAGNPFAPGRIILNRSLFACYLCNFFSFGGWLASLYFIPLYWQVTSGYSAAHAGLLLIPSILFGVSGSLAGGIYMKKTGKSLTCGISVRLLNCGTGHYYWITVIAYTDLTIGLALVLMFAGTITRSLPLMVIGSCMCSFGNGCGVTTTLIGLSM
jgi:hypothetical protein